jgi:hypothetical protein
MKKIINLIEKYNKTPYNNNEVVNDLMLVLEEIQQNALNEKEKEIVVDLLKTKLNSFLDVQKRTSKSNDWSVNIIQINNIINKYEQ